MSVLKCLNCAGKSFLFNCSIHDSFPMFKCEDCGYEFVVKNDNMNKNCDSNDSYNNGGTTDYYRIPVGSQMIQDLIEHKNMDFSQGNIFKAAWRLGDKVDVSKIYDLNKIIYFAQRLLKIEKDKLKGKENES